MLSILSIIIQRKIVAHYHNRHIFLIIPVSYQPLQPIRMLEKLLKMVRDLGQERTFAYMKFLLGCEKDY